MAGGLLDDAGGTALLVLETAAGALRLRLPATELPALFSVCVGLMGEALPEGGESEHPTIPISDWCIGLTETKEVVLALAPEAGGALAFHLTRDQAGALAEALNRALAAGEIESRARVAGRSH